jgi:hypothetical protein
MVQYLNISTNFSSEIEEIIQKPDQIKTYINLYFPNNRRKQFQKWKTIKIICENFEIINDQLAILKPESNIILIHPTVCSFAAKGNWPYDIGCFREFKMESIEIPNSITSLGNWCFYQCSSLTTIEVPSTLKSIGDYCFNFCKSLKSINFPLSLETIGKSCFGDKDFCFGNSLTKLPKEILNKFYKF